MKQMKNTHLANPNSYRIRFEHTNRSHFNGNIIENRDKVTEKRKKKPKI